MAHCPWMYYPSLRPPNFSCPAVSHTLNLMAPLLVWNTRGCTSTPRVATYFFSNSPVRCRLTKVVFPVPPSPTRTNLKVGISSPVAMVIGLVKFKSLVEVNQAILGL